MESSEYSRGTQAAYFHLVDGTKSSPHAHGQESQRQVFKCPKASRDRHDGKKFKIISVGLKPPRKGIVRILIHFSNPEVGTQPRGSPSHLRRCRQNLGLLRTFHQPLQFSSYLTCPRGLHCPSQLSFNPTWRDQPLIKSTHSVLKRLLWKYGAVQNKQNPARRGEEGEELDVSCCMLQHLG